MDDTGRLRLSNRFRLPMFGASMSGPAFRAGVTRAVVLPPTGIAALYTAHLELAALGAVRFGFLALLLGITLLLPFADLGVGAAVTTAVAADALPTAHTVVAASLRILAAAAACVVAVGMSLTAANLWSALTGVPSDAAGSLGRDMLVVIVLFGVGLPFALGGRILLSLNRYPIAILLQAGVPFLTLAIVLFYRDSAALTPFLIAPFAAQALVAIAGFAIACRGLQLKPRRLWMLVLTRSREAASRVRASAGPMLLIAIGLPLALQTDRLVLSHVSTATDLAQYAIVSVLFGPMWSIISSAGMTLWPRFARAKQADDADPLRLYARTFRAFAVAGLFVAATFFVLGPPATRVWAGSDGGGRLIWLSFALLLLVQAAHLPGGMFLTRPRELRFQAGCVGLMCIINLPLSIGLAVLVGAAGPVLASAATVCALQLLPARYRILRSRAGGDYA